MVIADSKIRTDRETGFICVTDIGNAKDQGGGAEHVANWLRNANTIAFIEAWEQKHSSNFNSVEFDRVKQRAGLNSFRISARDLVNLGASGIVAKMGRYGGTFCTIDWTIHFANWLDPHFYVETIDAFRRMNDALYGRDRLYHRFSRELVAENYGLVTQANDQRRIPSLPHPMTEVVKPGDRKSQVIRRLKQTDADILNLAIWGRTASQWRTSFPDQAIGNKNLRDYATQIELKVLNALQIIMRQLQEDQYTKEEKLDRLRQQAEELTKFYTKTPEGLSKEVTLRQERGW